MIVETKMIQHLIQAQFLIVKSNKIYRLKIPLIRLILVDQIIKQLILVHNKLLLQLMLHPNLLAVLLLLHQRMFVLYHHLRGLQPINHMQLKITSLENIL